MNSPLQGENFSAVEARSDLFTARLIDQALGLKACFGTQCAAQFLHDNLVNIDVGMRVLTRSDRRRKAVAPGLFQLRMYGSVTAIAYRHTHI